MDKPVLFICRRRSPRPSPALTCVAALIWFFLLVDGCYTAMNARSCPPPPVNRSIRRCEDVLSVAGVWRAGGARAPVRRGLLLPRATASVSLWPVCHQPPTRRQCVSLAVSVRVGVVAAGCRPVHPPLPPSTTTLPTAHGPYPPPLCPHVDVLFVRPTLLGQLASNFRFLFVVDIAMARRTRKEVLSTLRKRVLLFTILLAALEVGLIDKGDLFNGGGELSKACLHLCWGASWQTLHQTHTRRYLRRDRGGVAKTDAWFRTVFYSASEERFRVHFRVNRSTFHVLQDLLRVAYLLNIRILSPVAPLTGQYSRGGLN